MKGLYKILKQVEHSFKLKLLELMKIHLVFYIEKLQKDLSNSLLSQANAELSLLKLEDSKMEYEVQEVLTVKLIQGKLRYWI
ncbi:MAG: hypothetical protein M1813_000395 [Trichoglossum hirsutum]|nr:MAG: hypothetical protein M1813_000395 [Trichoglossum hirsutum]